MKYLSGYTFIEVLIATHILMFTFLVSSHVLMNALSKQHQNKRYHMALMSVHFASALRAGSGTPMQWSLWQAQLNRYIPQARYFEAAGLMHICWEDVCLFERSF